MRYDDAHSKMLRRDSIRSSQRSSGRQPLPTHLRHIGASQQVHQAPIAPSVADLNGGLSTTVEQWQQVKVSVSCGVANAGSVMML
jgi:hypothetical protein